VVLVVFQVLVDQVDLVVVDREDQVPQELQQHVKEMQVVQELVHLQLQVVVVQVQLAVMVQVELVEMV